MINKYVERGSKHIREQKNKPCTDCGVQYPYYVMHFDHVPERGLKLFSLTKNQCNRSIKSIDAEIAKCDLVCGNCHSERTHQRGQLVDMDKHKRNLNQSINKKENLKEINQYLSNSYKMCLKCGVRVTDVISHEEWHQKIERIKQIKENYILE